MQACICRPIGGHGHSSVSSGDEGLGDANTFMNNFNNYNK